MREQRKQRNIIRNICVQIKSNKNKKWNVKNSFRTTNYASVKIPTHTHTQFIILEKPHVHREWILFHLNYNKIWDGKISRKIRKKSCDTWDKTTTTVAIHAGKTFTIKSVFRTMERTNRDRNKFLLMAMKNHNAFETSCALFIFLAD